MFRMGRGSCDGCEGRRPWRFLGHTRGATVLLVAAVATCTLPSTATDTVNNLQTSSSRHSVRSLTCSVLLPSEYSASSAAPGLPVLEVERQHRISMPVRATTSSPEQRVVIHASLSSPVPLSCQHVKHNGQGRAPCRHSDIGSSHNKINNFLGNQDARLSIRLSHGFRQCSRHTTRAARPALPSCPDNPLRQSPSAKGGSSLPQAAVLGRCVCETDRRQGVVAPIVLLSRVLLRGHATRLGQDPGSMSKLLRTLCSLREEVCCLLGARSTRTQTPRGGHRRHTQEHTHSHTLHTLHGTAAITAAAGPELPCRQSSHWLPTAAAALASSAPSAIAPSESAKEPATGYRYVRHRLLLNRRGHYGWPTQGARPLEPMFSYLVFVSDCSSMRPQRLCCTALRFFTLATPKHGSIFASPHCCCSLPQA